MSTLWYGSVGLGQGGAGICFDILSLGQAVAFLHALSTHFAMDLMFACFSKLRTGASGVKPWQSPALCP